MKKLIAVACLLVCGSLFADEPKKVEVEVKKKPVEVKVTVQPKVGVALPSVRPLPGRYYWQHPTFGWGNWYYPAPAVPAPANYYFDQYGRVVPNGYVYDFNGNLVPLPVAAPYPYYYGRYYYGRWGWWR